MDPAPTFDRFKNGFFDRPAVVAAVGSMAARALSKGGSFVRQTAKRSLRYRNKPSPPGQPPSVHRDDRPGGTFRPTTKKDGSVVHRAVSPLKEFIFFAWESSSWSVIIGPASTNQIFFDRKRRASRGTVPGVLEQGGEITILEVLKGRSWGRADLRSPRRHANRPKRFRTVRIAARPFMVPALEKELPNFVGEFRFRTSVTAFTAIPQAA